MHANRLSNWAYLVLVQRGGSALEQEFDYVSVTALGGNVQRSRFCDLVPNKEKVL
jgi:hypothetical protein